MKKKLKKSLALVLAVCCAVQVPVSVSGVEAAATDTVSVEQNESAKTITIGNAKLNRTFSYTDDRLSTTEIRNLWGNADYTPKSGSEEFVISVMKTSAGEATTLEEYTQSEGSIEHVFDGIKNVTGNYWGSAEGDDNHLVVNFGSEKEVRTIDYTPRYDDSAKYNCTGRLTKVKVQYWDSENSEWTDATVNGDATITLTETDGKTEDDYKETAPDPIVLDEAVTTTKINLVCVESHFWSDSGKNKYMNVGELDILDVNGNSVIQKASEIPAKEIKTSELTLQSADISDTAATINDVEKTGKMITFSFAPVSMGTGSATIKEKVVMYDGDHFMRKFLEISCTDQDVRINSIDGEHLMVDENDKTWTIPTGVGGIVEMTEYKANLGQPIYINGMFLGSEFPETDTQIESDLGHVRYFSGKNFTDFQRDGQLTEDGVYVSWQTVLGASRSDGSDMGVIQSDFYEYINSIATPSEFRLQYNSWFDNMMYIDDENILSSFTEIEKELTQTGVRPMDSYVVDDGWNNYHGESVFDTGRSGTTLNEDGFWTFNSKFPDGLTPSSTLVNKLGSDFGVWIGPRGGYNYYGQLADILVKNGTGSKAGGSIDVADSEYLKNYEEMAIEWMEKYHINYWKWDGFADNAQYNAFPSGEGVVGYSETNRHMYGGPNNMYHVTDLWEKWITLMEHVREAEDTYHINNLWISLTCYTNPSPWFLQWANSVWLQCAGDRGEISNSTLNNKMDNMLTYRDANYYEFVEKHQFQFPLANVYNHDPIYGKTDTGITADSMTAEQFKNYLYMMGTRGTAFWELYYSDSLLDEEKYLVNAEFLEWAEENFDQLRNAKMIGEHPSESTTLSAYRNGGVYDGETQDPYGFSCFHTNGDSGIISMRNPAAEAKTITFTLNDAIGVTSNDTYYMSTEHTYSPTTVTEVSKTTYQKGDVVRVTLQPGEVQIWSLSTTKDETAPEFYSITNVSDMELHVQTDEKLKGDAKFTVKVNGTAAEAAVKQYADCRTFQLTLKDALKDGDQVEVTASAGADSAGNRLKGSISLAYYKDNQIAAAETVTGNAQQISTADRSVTGINGFTVTASVQTAEKNVVLVQQGDAYQLGIDADGYPYFTMNGTTVKGNVTVSKDYASVLSAVRENNGLIRLYVDGEIQNSVYKEANKAYSVQAAAIVASAGSGTLENVTVYDVSLGYDEVPASELSELVTKISGEEDQWTESSWTAANMTQLLKTAKDALESRDAEAMSTAKDALSTAYKTLVPRVYKNLALNKTVTAAWADGTTDNVTNSGSPLTKAVDGDHSNDGSHAIYGKDGIDKGAYMQIDLGELCEISNVKLWRYWSDNRTYKSTAVLVSETDDFAEAKLLYYSGDSDIYNFDAEPTEELYQETSEGKVLYNGTAVPGRYVRLYVHGKVADTATENHIVEIQVNGKTASFDPYHLKEYKTLLAEAEEKAKETGVYTADSMEALNAQITASKALIETLEGEKEPDKTVAEVETAMNALKAAVDALEKQSGNSGSGDENTGNDSDDEPVFDLVIGGWDAEEPVTTWKNGNDRGLSFKADITEDEFVKLYMDNDPQNEVAKVNYTITVNGSAKGISLFRRSSNGITITLKEGFLKTLADGDHVLAMMTTKKDDDGNSTYSVKFAVDGNTGAGDGNTGSGGNNTGGSSSTGSGSSSTGGESSKTNVTIVTSGGTSENVAAQSQSTGVKTGDTANTVLLLSCCLTAACGMLVLHKKRKENI